MPGTVMPETSSGYLQNKDVDFVREKSFMFFKLPLDKSHFITEVHTFENFFISIDHTAKSSEPVKSKPDTP